MDFSELIKCRDESRQKAVAAQKALEAICEAIGHDMKYSGRDSHYDWHTCARCEYEERS